MGKAMPDKIIDGLKDAIGIVEEDSFELANHVELFNDRKLSHTMKILLGMVQSMRSYVLGNVDRLKDQIRKGGDSIGKKDNRSKGKG